MYPPYVLFPNRDQISYELDFFQNNCPLYGSFPRVGSNTNNMVLCMVRISGKQHRLFFILALKKYEAKINFKLALSSFTFLVESQKAELSLKRSSISKLTYLKYPLFWLSSKGASTAFSTQLKGLSHEIDFKNFDKKLHNLD
jgi:hypothetical protein